MNQETSLDISDITGRLTSTSTEDELTAAVTELRAKLNELENLEFTDFQDDINFNQASTSKKRVTKSSNATSLEKMKARIDEQTRRQRYRELHFAYTLEVSPGSIKVGRKQIEKREKEKISSYKPKQVISEWSPKSRSNMVARLCTLDFTPLVSNPYQPPAMLTLTYPNDSELLASDGGKVKQHLYKFKKRYERKYGTLYGVMKLEFTRNKAPHLHILCSPPNTQEFKDWLGEAWSESVNHPNPATKKLHRENGTNIKYDERFRTFQSKKIAAYFLKHSSPHGGSKEYQNIPPEAWVKAGKVGRFWCYWGLKPLVKKVPITFREAKTIARTLRRFARNNHKPETKKPMRRIVVERNITVKRKIPRETKVRKRRVSVPVKRFPNMLGYLSVPDGARMTRYLTRVLTLERTGRC